MFLELLMLAMISSDLWVGLSCSHQNEVSRGLTLPGWARISSGHGSVVEEGLSPWGTVLLLPLVKG